MSSLLQLFASSSAVMLSGYWKSSHNVPSCKQPIARINGFPHVLVSFSGKCSCCKRIWPGCFSSGTDSPSYVCPMQYPASNLLLHREQSSQSTLPSSSGRERGRISSGLQPPMLICLELSRCYPHCILLRQGAIYLPTRA